MTLLNGGRRRQLVRGLAFASVAAAGYAFGIAGDRAVAQPGQPGALPPGPGAPAAKAGAQSEPDRRVTALIYGNVPVTREELGEFLIARGGHEKLELLVNKKIIEVEATRRGVTVTPTEITATLEEDVRGLGISRADFVKHVLPRYGKSLFEWTEDVIRPRLLLTKMCQGRVVVADEDVLKLYENRYGERRQPRLIIWNKNDLKTAQKQWDEARKSDADFRRIAKMQADPNLAAAEGLAKPVGKHPETEDDTVVKTLYSLKRDEISGIIEVPSGLMCIKFAGEVPPEANVKFDEATKAALRKELFAQKLEREIPKQFHELKMAAKPQLYLKGPPSAAEFREGVEQIINQAGGVPTGANPAQPTPAPTKP